GSEPVSPEAMSAFAVRFSDCGLRADALHTVYGLAENVMVVSASTPRHRPRHARICERTWRESHRAEPPSVDSPAIVQVSNGPCIPDCEVKIAAEDGKILEQRNAGRVLVRSPFLFGGYFRRDDLNSGLLDGEGFLDTGDVGWLDEDGHLYVTGRRKDVVIVRGRNVY